MNCFYIKILSKFIQKITINYLIQAINNKTIITYQSQQQKSPMHITSMFQLTNATLNKQQFLNKSNLPNSITISHALFNKYRYRYKQQHSQKIGVKNSKPLYQNQDKLQRQQQLNSFRQQSVQHENYTSFIDQIIQQSLSSAYVQYRDVCYYSQNQQFMKRQYYDTEYKAKIQNLSEYYKFHKNLPVWNNKGVSNIMERYYNKIKDIDYKKVKSILKRQQGISLTTRKSFSSFDQSQYSVHSRYSNMLQNLQNSNDSLLLRDFCDKIDVALKKVKIQKNFKGTYYSGQNKFQEFLRKQQRRKQNNYNKSFHKQMKNSQKKKEHLKNSFGLQTAKFSKNQIQNHHQSKRQLQKQTIFSSTQLIKQNHCLPPKPKKIQKYQKDQKINDGQTRTQKNNSLHKTKQKIENIDTIKNQLQKSKQKQNAKSKQKTKSKTKTKVSQNIKNQFINSKFGTVKGFNIAQIALNQSIQPKKQNKILSKSKSTAKLTQRSRSNSTYNLQWKPTTFIKQNSKKQLISSIKTNRSSSINKSNSNSQSKFSSNLHMPLPRTAAKGTVIELTQLTNLNKTHNKNDKSLALASRDNSIKRLRSNSNSNLNAKISTKFFMNNINKSTNSTNQNHTKSQSQYETKILKQNKSGLHTHLRTKTSTTNLNFNLQSNVKNSDNILIDLNLNQLANTNKLNTSITKNKTSIKNLNQKLFAKKRDSVVESMVQKKLISIKRKLAVN